MLKKVQVVMLPTNEKAQIVKMPHGKLEIKNQDSQGKDQHLYFLSDEEIKEGDWFLPTIGSLKGQPCKLNKGCKTSDKGKIIATTDSSLKVGHNYGSIEYGDKTVDCNDYLPQPSQSFLEVYVKEYNKGNVIKEVMVEYEERSSTEFGKYAIEKMGEQNLRLKVNPKDNTITIKRVKDSWNREELISVVGEWISNTQRPTESNFKKWIEKNL